jgi:hypothetical protein
MASRRGVNFSMSGIWGGVAGRAMGKRVGCRKGVAAAEHGRNMRKWGEKRARNDVFLFRKSPPFSYKNSMMWAYPAAVFTSETVVSLAFRRRV